MKNTISSIFVLFFILGCKQSIEATGEKKHSRNQPSGNMSSSSGQNDIHLNYIDPAIIARIGFLFSPVTGNVSMDTLHKLEISPGNQKPVLDAIQDYFHRANDLQGVSFESHDFQLNDQREIPGLTSDQLLQLEDLFKKDLPGGLDDGQRNILEKVVSSQIRSEFGENVKVSLIENKHPSLEDFQAMPKRLPGLKFQITKPDKDGMMQSELRSAVILKGTRFDFLHVASDVDGQLRSPSPAEPASH